MEVYYSDIRDCLARRSELEALLPPGRAGRMREFLRDADRLRCLAGWTLMAHILGRRGFLPDEAVTYGPYGKPRLVNGPHCNLSHSGNYVLLAVGAVELGADIEEWRDDDFLALAGTAFHATERKWLRKNLSAEAFFKMWAAKESYLKWLGTGLSREPSSFVVSLQGNGGLVAEYPGLHLRLYEELSGYSAAVCAAARLPERLIMVSLA